MTARSATRRPAEAAPAACCPLPENVEPLPLVAGEDPGADALAARAKALADPVRLRMLAVIAAAEKCCRPAAGDGPGQAPAGVCVCELQTLQGLAQSKVSYHLRVLREAGLVLEERHGKWSFYTLDVVSARGLLAELAARLGA
jgi:ArsR family transcriptional regulator, arsenate/arsenite/antimonite-responsive transcriptional repressor